MSTTDSNGVDAFILCDDLDGVWYEEPALSEHTLTDILAIINDRRAYTMQEFAIHCRKFRNLEVGALVEPLD